MNAPLSLSLVVPVYRSETLLPALLERVNRVLAEHCPHSEIVLVNDGSPDRSWQVISDLRASYPRVRALNLMRNYGQHNALLAGIEAARGLVIVTLDDDLQTPPEEIPKLLAELERGFDLVYGVRESEQHSLVRNSCSVGVKWVLNRMLGVKIASSITSYRAFRAELRQAFTGRVGNCVFIDALLCWGTSKVGSIVVSHKGREGGKSGYSLGRLIVHTANMVTSFSHVPLQVASFIGLAATVLGALVFLYVLGSFLIAGKTVPGFTFLAAAITLFSGIQLFVLGIMGEYLARMHQRLMGAPSYVVREEV